MSDEEESEDIDSLVEHAKSHREEFQQYIDAAKERFTEQLVEEFDRDVEITVEHDSDDEQLVAEVEFVDVVENLGGDAIAQESGAVFTYNTGWSGPPGEEYESGVIEAGVSHEQRARTKDLKETIATLEQEFQEQGAPEQEIIDEMADRGYSRDQIENDIEKLKGKGEVYMPAQGYLRSA